MYLKKIRKNSFNNIKRNQKNCEKSNKLGSESDLIIAKSRKIILVMIHPPNVITLIQLYKIIDNLKIFILPISILLKKENMILLIIILINFKILNCVLKYYKYLI